MLIEVICFTISEGLEINNSLVNPHLELIPGFRTLSTRSLTCGDTEGLCWHADWTLHFKFLVLSPSDQVTTDLLQRFDIARGQGYPDTVDWSLLLYSFSILVSRHFGRDSALIRSPALNLINLL